MTEDFKSTDVQDGYQGVGGAHGAHPKSDASLEDESAGASASADASSQETSANVSAGAGADASASADAKNKSNGESEKSAGEEFPPSSDASDTAASTKAAEADLEQQLADMKDKYVRLQAEWDNYRKRTAQERADERSRATENLVTNLLQVVDDLERAIDNANVDEKDPMLAGVKAVYNKFVDILTREGLKAINPARGEAFDIHSEQAVQTVENKELPDGSIEQVYQKGYWMGDKLLRSAMVVVTSGGPKREA